MVKRNFPTQQDNRARQDEEEYERRPCTQMEMDTMSKRVKKALAGTKNKTALGLGRISYRVMKTVKDTWLEHKLVETVAKSILEGVTPGEWQEMMVVFIPKPGKNTGEARSWRPISLINCMAKLAEKVVADALQDVQELLHWVSMGEGEGGPL